jgi:hypothetical protein
VNSSPKWLKKLKSKELTPIRVSAYNEQFIYRGSSFSQNLHIKVVPFNEKICRFNFDFCDNVIISIADYHNTPAVATHLLSDPKSVLTPVGDFLRKSSLDELPQLWSIFKGHMSFVGPRPALFNQDDLIDLRTSKGVHKLVPGLTGWAQINGRDELPIPKKVALDVEYLRHQSLWIDFKIMWLTFIKVIKKDGVSH